MALTALGRAAASGRIEPARTTVDWDFCKGLAYELVFAWQDAGEPGAVRDALERVMMNVGIETSPDGQWTLATPGGGWLDLGSR